MDGLNYIQLQDSKFQNLVIFRKYRVLCLKIASFKTSRVKFENSEFQCHDPRNVTYLIPKVEY